MGGRRRLNQISGRASPQEPVDVKNAEGKNEGVDDAGDHECTWSLALPAGLALLAFAMGFAAEPDDGPH
jgi:hypothetical protein